MYIYVINFYFLSCISFYVVCALVMFNKVLTYLITYLLICIVTWTITATMMTRWRGETDSVNHPAFLCLYFMPHDTKYRVGPN